MPANPQTDPTFARLSASDEAASFALLTELCRHCPSFRLWLFKDFGRKERTRNAFKKGIDGETFTPPPRFRELTGVSHSWQEEQRCLREFLPSRPFGGLSRVEVETLIRRYQAGSIDLGTFLLAKEWRKAKSPSPASIWASVAFLGTLFQQGGWRTHRHIGKTLAFLRHFEQQPKRAILGYSNWWKLQILFYLLKHPQPAYTTRELRGHLLSLGVEMTAKEIRRFCGAHKIRRDMRAGRPRITVTAAPGR